RAGTSARRKRLGGTRGRGPPEAPAREGGEKTETGKGKGREGAGPPRPPGVSRRDGKEAGAPAAGDREGEAVRGADRLFPHELVAVHLHDTHLGESSGREATIPQVNYAVDPGRLARRAAFEGKSRVLARPIDQ